MTHQLLGKGTTFKTTNIKQKFFYTTGLDTLRSCFLVYF